jgi:formylglycine-generating enzyme required for sulfatase activity
LVGACAQTPPKPGPDPRAVAAGDAARGGREGMTLIAAGEFKMGSSPADNWAESDEQPQRVVNLPAFYIDELEVTQLQYKQFVDASGWPPPRDWKEGTFPEDTEFLPVTGVTWWDANAYARWAGKRLPTEAEWEKAARGSDGRRFPWGDAFEPDHANNSENLLPVGSKPTGASPYGVQDMAGNVSEWTSSIYAPYPKIEAILPGEFGGTQASASAPATTETSAPQPGHGRRIESDDPRLQVFTVEELQDDRQRVYRGGSYNNYARFLRCASRQGESPDARWEYVGFRCAADAGGGTAP